MATHLTETGDQVPQSSQPRGSTFWGGLRGLVELWDSPPVLVSGVPSPVVQAF